jgi:hypothetical protein
MWKLASPFNAFLPFRRSADLLGKSSLISALACFAGHMILLCLVASGLLAGSLTSEPSTARTVVRADPRSGRLVRRVVAPAAIFANPVPRPVGRAVVMLPSRPVGSVKPPLHEVIEEVSRQQGVDPLLVHAVIQVESGYNRFAISPKGAEGLMQLIPSTAKEMGVRNSFDTRENIEGGVKYLRGLMERFPDLAHALAAYNAGPGAVARWQGIPPYAETRAYVSKVGERYGDLRRCGAGPRPAAASQGAPSGAGSPAQPERLPHIESSALECRDPENTAAAVPAKAEPEYRPLESFLDEQGRLHLRTK